MLVLGLLLFVSLFVLNFNVVVPLLARDVLGEGAHGFGLLMAALGVRRRARRARRGERRPAAAVDARWWSSAAVVASAGVLALGFVRSFALAAAILVVTGSRRSSSRRR